MSDRCWREVAVWWLKGMEVAIGKHFMGGFFARHERMLREGTERELVEAHDEYKRYSKIAFGLADGSSSVFYTNSNDGWLFVARYNAVFAALYQLALEDFR